MIGKPTTSQNWPKHKKTLSLTNRTVNIGRCTLCESFIFNMSPREPITVTHQSKAVYVWQFTGSGQLEAIIFFSSCQSFENLNYRGANLTHFHTSPLHLSPSKTKFGVFTWAFYGLAYYQEGKDIVMFRFTVEYSSSLRDFGPY
jgi:hypothetical protein